MGTIPQLRLWCEADLRTPALTQLGFKDAAEAWLETRKPYLSPKTIHEYRLNIKTLDTFFGAFRLSEISGDQIRAYQRMRMGSCGPSAINHECSVLQQLLKRIGRWPDVMHEYQPLPLSKEKRGRVLRDEQREMLLRIARENPNWEAACLFAMISVNTTAGPKETATLRLKDIDLARKIMSVQPEGAKNVHRIRAIPLNEEAFEAANAAVSRAKRLGASDPSHYVFPFRINRALFDPTRHQTSFKTAWNKLIVKAQLPGFRMYDLRHHAITVLLENPVASEETAEAIAGHISREMKKRYSHVRMAAKWDAVSALNPKSKRLPTPQKEPKPPKNAAISTDLLQQLALALTKLLKTG